MKVVQKIFTYALLMFITLSSVGISFYLHQCGCRETTLFSFEAGYSEPTEFCCCSVEPIASENTSCKNEVDEEKCCQEQYFFFLIPFGPEKVTSDVKPFIGKIFNSLSPVMVIYSEASRISQQSIKPDPPPLLITGKQFVYFIQQIKIPFPIS